MKKKDTSRRSQGAREHASSSASGASSPDAREMDAYEARLRRYWPKLVSRLEIVYGDRPDLPDHLNALQKVCRRAWVDRDASLK